MRDSDARVMEDPTSSVPDNGSSLEITRTATSERAPSAVENAFGVRGTGCYEADIGDIDDVDDGQPRYASGTSSAMGAVANFMNSIVGAGIVGLPYAVAQVCVAVCLCSALLLPRHCQYLLQLLRYRRVKQGGKYLRTVI